MLQIFSKKLNRGFTLIELLVVIAIIGLLASITLVYLGGARSKARDARRRADIRQIAEAMELAYFDDEKYPSIAVDTSDKLTTNVIASATQTYMYDIPADPGGTANYFGKANSANRQKYCIYADLENAGYVCASEAGVLESTAVPALGACCY